MTIVDLVHESINQLPMSTQLGHPSDGNRDEYQQKLGSKQAQRVMH